MSLADAQQRVDAWISQYEEGYFHPLTNLARLTEEVGELAREVNHRFGQKTKKWDEAEGDLAMEMADILFVLVCMANREGIDLEAAFDRMMAKVETRDRDRWTKKGGQEGGRADRRSGGQADRRTGGQADRRSVNQADGWADDR
jgi:NTP pyrophosphatase (non-canonical NTP hydrolase)